jgi:hypothetical protein
MKNIRMKEETYILRGARNDYDDNIDNDDELNAHHICIRTFPRIIQSNLSEI